MKRLLTVIRWGQFIGWCALWLWSVVSDDPNQPWRVMFSITCALLALDMAFKPEPPKEANMNDAKLR